VDPMTFSCDSIRPALGAYALRALEPAEREQVDAHLEGCPACREELATLTATARALGHLAATDALAAGEEATGRGLLGRALAELARRRRRLRLRLAGGGVALALAASGAAAGVALATRPATPATAPAAAHLTGTDPDTGVAAQADLFAESWGTSIHMTISGVSSGARCQLVAVARDGSQEVAGSWHVGYSGAAAIEGATGMSPGQLASLRVMTSRGAMLIALTMPSASSP
jgi:predicted anti-sigma-YlaC factor YlaD